MKKKQLREALVFARIVLREARSGKDVSCDRLDTVLAAVKRALNKRAA